MLQTVTPWDVQGGSDGRIDYDKLSRQFGCSTITEELIARCTHSLHSYLAICICVFHGSHFLSSLDLS